MYALAAALYRLSLCRVYPELHVRPNRCAAAGALGENSRDDSGFYFAQYRDSSHLARSWRALVYLPMRRRTPAASAKMPITIAGMTMLGTSAMRPTRMR